MSRPTSALPIACVLGLFALLPFGFAVYRAYTLYAFEAGSVLTWLLPYLATVVSFIGGVQWGRMLAGEQANALDMSLAVTPALAAWGALLLGSPWQGPLLLVILIWAWLIDEHGARCGWQSRGFLALRRLLTAAVTVALVLIGWRVIRG